MPELTQDQTIESLCKLSEVQEREVLKRLTPDARRELSASLNCEAERNDIASHLPEKDDPWAVVSVVPEQQNDPRVGKSVVPVIGAASENPQHYVLPAKQKQTLAEFEARKPRLLRDPRSHAGFKVLHSGHWNGGPIVLPPIAPIILTAEDIWAARVEAERKRRQGFKAQFMCPPGSLLIPLGTHFNPKAVPFAIIDEEDFDRVSQYRWGAWVKSGKTHAVTPILSNTRHQMSRFILNINHRYIKVFHRGDTFDNRKCNLVVDRSKIDSRAT